ncbi:hypothetical protein SESBI_05434 [Sesbania bispinosa]|nr:hypothetical protein SESBI_05434 [Sesbania bispinosa]
MIRTPWKRARMEIIDLDNEYFVVRFEDLDDLQHVFDDGPWMLGDHYIVIQRRQLGFVPYEDDLRRVAVWVRVPGLPIEFYDKRVLWSIGNALGKTVKIDVNTLQERGNVHGDFIIDREKFARICIEVDLNRILISKFSSEGRIYPVEYEGLHLVCFQCGRYGHKKDNYSLTAMEDGKKTQLERDPVGESTVARRETAAPSEDKGFSALQDQVDVDKINEGLTSHEESGLGSNMASVHGDNFRQEVSTHDVHVPKGARSAIATEHVGEMLTRNESASLSNVRHVTHQSGPGPEGDVEVCNGRPPDPVLCQVDHLDDLVDQMSDREIDSMDGMVEGIAQSESTVVQQSS